MEGVDSELEALLEPAGRIASRGFVERHLPRHPVKE